MMKLEGRFWITHNGKSLGGRGRMELLSRIGSVGSITQAAKAMGMSYKSAWDAVDAMNNAAGAPLVQRSAGGKGGGGTRLTEEGLQLLAAYRRFETLHLHFLEQLAEDPELASCQQALEQLQVRSSARNQLAGTVVRLTREGLQDMVELQLRGGQHLHVQVTHSSAERLSLAAGVEVLALVKAPWVRLADDSCLLNRLVCTVTALEQDGENLELQLDLDGETSLSALLHGAARRQAALAPGRSCTIHIDPENVVLCTQM